MTQAVPLNYGDPAAEAFFDSLQELVSGGAFNFRLTAISSTTVRVPAGVGHAQVGIAIDPTGSGNAYRYITANADRTISGAAGTYDLFVTASNSDFSGTAPNIDHTVYSFALAAVAHNATPSGVDRYRKVGEVDWNGTAITALRQTVNVPGAVALAGMPPIGTIIAYAFTGAPAADPSWDVADGGLLDRATSAGASFFAGAGHRYNLGIDPGSNRVRKPDKRGRSSIGAIDMGTGAATIDSSRVNIAAGAHAGESTHTQTASEAGTSAHGHAVSDPGHAHNPSLGGWGSADATAAVPDIAALIGSGAQQNPSGYTTSTAATGLTVVGHAGAAAVAAMSLLHPVEADVYLVRVQ